ncbi:MAG: 16S rRNA (guanine(966)-N(2))-methyltransferase RsmD [Candidatus Velthaea sp.]
MGSLKIAGGMLRSRRLSAPSGRAVRPTPARVKEALFSILAGSLESARVLDLYAGSGALGFEALSRGAAYVTFVESHRPTALAIEKTACELDVAERCEFVIAPAELAATRLRERYDLIFADPPYALPYPAQTFARLRETGALDMESLVIYEYSARSAAPLDARFTVVRSERYGAVALAFLRAAA